MDGMALSEDSPAPATILDVARRAGVSRTTVSRVLNEPDRVSRDILERVRTAARELDYVPSSVARSLRSGKTGTIALLVGDISQPFHGALAKAVAHAADERGKAVVLGDLEHSDERLIEALARAPRQGIDGIIIATGDDLSNPAVSAAVRAIVDQGIPVVTSATIPPGTGALELVADYPAIADRATSELLASGRRRVALLVGDRRGSYAAGLERGYREAVARAGAEPLIADGRYDFARSVAEVSALLAGPEPADGVVAATTPMALAVLRAVEAQGLSVPDDVALIACEDVLLAQQVRPALTTVYVDPVANGAELVRVLSEAIDGRSPLPADQRIEVARRESAL